MNGNEAGIIGVLSGLFFFGALYGVLVNHVNRHLDTSGLLSFEVAFGTLVTIAGMALLDMLVSWPAWVNAGACFSASGFPMIVLDIVLAKIDAARVTGQRADQLIKRTEINGGNGEMNDGDTEKALA